MLCCVTFCSWKPDTYLSLKLGLDPTPDRKPRPVSRASANNPVSVEAMHCFVISISGAGISEGVSSAQIGDRAPACFGFGAITEGMTLYDLTRTGRIFRVPIGTGRTIRVLGVHSTNLGRGCAGKTLPEIFATVTRPRIFELGSATSDLYRDSKVTIKNSYSPGAATDLAETCSSSTGSGSTGDPTADPVARGARLIAFNTDNGSSTNLFNYNIENDGTLREIQSASFNAVPRALAVSPDGANLMAMGVPNISGTSENIRHFPIDIAGTSAGMWTHVNAATLGSGLAYGLAFAFRPGYFFQRDGSSVYQNIYFASTNPIPNSPGVFSSANLKHMTPAGDFLFAMLYGGGSPTADSLVRMTISNTGTLGSSANMGNFSEGQLSAPVFDKASSRLFVATEKNLLSYDMSVDGGLHPNNPFGIPVTLPGSITIQKMRFDSAKSRLFVWVKDAVAGVSELRSLPVNRTTGIISATAVTTLAFNDPNTRDFAISPDGNYVYLTLPGPSSALMAFKEVGDLYTIIQSLPPTSSPYYLEIIPLL